MNLSSHNFCVINLFILKTVLCNYLEIVTDMMILRNSNLKLFLVILKVRTSLCLSRRSKSVSWNIELGLFRLVIISMVEMSWNEQLALENVGLCKMVRRQLVGTRRGLIIISTILHQSVLGPGGANCWDASRVDEIVGLNFSLKNPWLEKKRERETWCAISISKLRFSM